MSAETHILIISSWYPTPEKPFLGNFVQRQAALLAMKYNVSVIHTYPSEKAGTIQTKEDAFKEYTLAYEHGKNSINNYLNRRRAYQALLDEVSTPDLIIGMVAIPIGSEFIRAKKKFGCKLIYFEHGSFYNPAGKYKWDFRKIRMRTRLGQYADRIIAVSEVLKNDMQPYFPNRKIEVLPNHIDTDRFSLNEKNPQRPMQFLHISTLDDNKNPKGILEACRLLKDEGLNFRLKIISDESYENLRLEANQLGLGQCVEFCGPLEWKDIVPHYHQSAALILFSNYETFSIVLAEAFATGTPVISTNTGIMKEANVRHGLVIEKGNSKSLADAMRKLIKGEVRFQSTELRAFGELFSAEKVMKQWGRVIDEIVSSR